MKTRIERRFDVQLRSLPETDRRKLAKAVDSLKNRSAQGKPLRRSAAGDKAVSVFRMSVNGSEFAVMYRQRDGEMVVMDIVPRSFRPVSARRPEQQ